MTFEDCYQAHRRRVYQWALRYGGGKASWAEDLTQDVFLRLLEHFPRLDGHHDLGGWLYRVTANLALTRLRTERSWVGRLRRLLGAEEADAVEGPPDLALVREEEAGEVLATLQSLPGQERVVLCMKVLEGKTQKEIAQVLSLSEGYVSKLLTRAWAHVSEAGWEVDHAEG